MIGAATRVFRDHLGPPAWAVPAALTALAVQSVIPLRGTAFTYLAGGPAIALLTGVLLLSWRTWTDVTTPALRALTWLGTVSYGAYLWNYPLSIWLRPYLDAWAGVAALAGTLVLAAVSWHGIERPLRRVLVA